MTRTTVERVCLETIETVEQALGASSLMTTHPAARIGADLRLYLRQPAPDAVLLGAAEICSNAQEPFMRLWKDARGLRAMSDPTTRSNPTISRWSTAPMPIRGNSKPAPTKTAKYDATLAALPQGALCQRIRDRLLDRGADRTAGQRCDRLLAVDVVAEVLDRARKRCRELPQVRFALMEDSAASCRTSSSI